METVKHRNVTQGSHSMDTLSIAIDGPAGAGKSTVAKEVASRLGITYIDTGAMYRGVAWLAVHYNVSMADEFGIVNLLQAHDIAFERDPQGRMEVFIDGVNRTLELRSPEVSACVSQISVFASVRNYLTSKQREFSEKYPVVMDGRDIGTVVLPNATVKVFLTASLEERARRRLMELGQNGYETTLEELQNSIQERDARDSSRDLAPLKQADDAVLVDTTGKEVEEVVSEILRIVELVKK